MREVRPTALERDREEECEENLDAWERDAKLVQELSINSRLCRCSSLSCTDA